MHILQVAYYPTLRDIRAEMLRAAGYRVTSILGNHEAMMLDREFLEAADLAIVGSCADHSVRTEMIHWLKAHCPKIPVLALQLNEWEEFREADKAALSGNPKAWLAAIADLIQAQSAEP